MLIKCFLSLLAGLARAVANRKGHNEYTRRIERKLNLAHEVLAALCMAQHNCQL